MELDPFSSLNLAPLLPELLHHLPPNKHVLCVLLLDALLSLLLEHVQPERFLNLSCF